jgi:hypothetical protein
MERGIHASELTPVVFLCALAAIRGWVRKIASVGTRAAAHD